MNLKNSFGLMSEEALSGFCTQLVQLAVTEGEMFEHFEEMGDEESGPMGIDFEHGWTLRYTREDRMVEVKVLCDGNLKACYMEVTEDESMPACFELQAHFSSTSPTGWCDVWMLAAQLPF